MEFPPTQEEDLARLPATELIRRSVAGDGNAFAVLVVRYQGRVHSLALRITKNDADAEDVTQEVFLKILRKLPAFDGRAAFSTWLVRITMNTAITFVRQRNRQRAVEEAKAKESPEALFDPGVDHCRIELEEETHAALAKLPSRDAAILRLCFLNGLPASRVATLLGRAPSTVGIWHRAALARASKICHLRDV